MSEDDAGSMPSGDQVTASLLQELYRNIHDAELLYSSGIGDAVNDEVRDDNAEEKETVFKSNTIGNKRKLDNGSQPSDEPVSRNQIAASRKLYNMEFYRESTVGLALKAALDRYFITIVPTYSHWFVSLFSLLDENKINVQDLAAIWDYYDECFVPALSNLSDKIDVLSIHKRKTRRDVMNIVGKMESYHQYRGSLKIDSTNVVVSNGSSTDLRYKRLKLLLHS